MPEGADAQMVLAGKALRREGLRMGGIKFVAEDKKFMVPSCPLRESNTGGLVKSLGSLFC